MRHRLIGVGTVVVDLVADVPALPERGGDVLASRMLAMAGGAFNVLVAAARQGLDVAYAGPHGAGPFGDVARRALRAAGIAVLLPPRERDTGVVVTVVDRDGERSFVTGPDAVVGATAEDLSGVRPTAGDAVHVSGYGLVHPATRDALVGWLASVPPAVPVLVDPGPLAPWIAPAALVTVLERAEWCSANAREATAITGEPDPVPAAAALARRTGHGVVVRTGAAGCVVAAPGAEQQRVAGFAVTAVDTTGAGDTHAGVFLADLVRGAAPLAAARRANAAAALSVTRYGPATAPTAAELDALVRASR